jgi:hypothetical protein
MHSADDGSAPPPSPTPPPYSEFTFACKTCDVELVRRLLLAKTDVNAVDSVGQSALLCAVEGGHVMDKSAQRVLIKLLLARRARTDTPAHDGRTPIWCACRWGLIDAMRLLMEAKADPLRQAKWGESSIDVAVRYKRVSLLKEVKLASPEAAIRLGPFLQQYSEGELIDRMMSDQVRVFCGVLPVSTLLTSCGARSVSGRAAGAPTAIVSAPDAARSLLRLRAD